MRSLILRAFKLLLHQIGYYPFTRRVALEAIRLGMQRLRHGRLRDFLIGPITSYLLPPTYRTPITLCDGTRMYGGPRDILTRMLLYFGGVRECWEPQTLRLASLIGQTGGDVLIGGAHVGYFAIRLARTLKMRGTRIFAFEPLESVYRELLDNIALNDVPNLTVERCALSRVVGEDILYIQGIRSSLLQPKKGFVDRRERVSVTTIDGYLNKRNLDNIALVLLDIEGAELSALQGASSLLGSAGAPDIVFEIIPSGDFQNASTVGYLRQFGYQIFYIEDDYDLIFSLEGDPIRLRSLDACRKPHLYYNVLATREPELLVHLGVHFIV